MGSSEDDRKKKKRDKDKKRKKSRDRSDSGDSRGSSYYTSKTKYISKDSRTPPPPPPPPRGFDATKPSPFFPVPFYHPQLPFAPPPPTAPPPSTIPLNPHGGPGHHHGMHGANPHHPGRHNPGMGFVNQNPILKSKQLHIFKVLPVLPWNVLFAANTIFAAQFLPNDLFESVMSELWKSVDKKLKSHLQSLQNQLNSLPPATPSTTNPPLPMSSSAASSQTANQAANPAINQANLVQNIAHFKRAIKVVAEGQSINDKLFQKEKSSGWASKEMSVEQDAGNKSYSDFQILTQYFNGGAGDKVKDMIGTEGLFTRDDFI